MPTPLKPEETEYFYDSSLDDLYPGEPERADTEYEFDPISTQEMEKVAEIERQALEKLDNATPVPMIMDDGGNTETIATEMDEVSAILQDCSSPQAMEHSEDGMDIFVHSLTAVQNYKDLNEEVLSIISQGAVACIPSHFESRSASWSSHTCFAELGVKPQFETTLNDETTSISLADILNGGKQDLLFVPTSQWCLPPSIQELEDSYNILWGNKSYTFAPPDAAHSHSFLHFFTPDAATIKQFPGRISCTMMEVKHGNGSIVFFRHRNWATCSNFGDLRTILEQMNSDTTNIRYMRVNIAQGDCFVIPPGTQYVIHPSSNIILAACNFFHRCNLQQSYGLNEIQFQLPGDRDTLKKYWLQVCKDIANNAPPSLSKLHEIMQNNLEQGEIILFSGKGWLHPFL